MNAKKKIFLGLMAGISAIAPVAGPVAVQASPHFVWVRSYTPLKAQPVYSYGRGSSLGRLYYATNRWGDIDTWYTQTRHGTTITRVGKR